MFKIFTLFTSIVFFALSAVIAQPINTAIKDVSMPAPNAASLGKYGDIPVGHYTGVPNIGMPIHTITDGPLSYPVSLSYHAGGIKVGEPVSWIGQGWSLSGNMISRTIQGKADESCDGYFTSGRFIAVQNDTCIVPAAPYTYVTLQNGNTDAEPDIFSFSVGGCSGKFYIEADMTNDNVVNGKVVLIPKQDVRVTYETSGSCGTLQLKKFTVTTPDGVRYEFGNIDNDANNKGIDIQQFDEIVGSTVSAWQLRRISSADGNYSINLDYVQEKYRYQHKASGSSASTLLPFPTTTPSGSYYYHVTDVLGWRLSSITNGGATNTVTFLAATATREDLSVSPWNVGSSPQPPKALASIQVQSGTLCKKYDLAQSYYEDTTADKSGTTADKRLKLTLVQEKSCDGTVTANPYTFQYHELAGNTSFLPNRMSSGIDHWGFYNGAVTNPHSGLNIPLTKLPTYTVGGYNVHPVKGGANRETNEAMMMLGTLRSISWPTGGLTSFEYQANTVYGNKDVLTFTDMGTMTRAPGGCSVYLVAAGSFNIATQTATEIGNLYYQWIKNPPPPQPSTCSEGTHLDIRLINATTSVVLATVSTSLLSTQTTQTAEGILTELFSGVTIPAGTPLRFEIWGKNMTGSFTLRKLTTTTTSENYAVGGLRIKKVTSNDGTTTGQDVIKSYSYAKAVIPGQSSAILYAKPIYGYVFQGCIGSCNGIRTGSGACPGNASQLLQTHFFFETSVVPLGSFEGYHIGYSAVQEYFNGSNSGYYNLYQYYNDPVQAFNGIPLVPVQPRIGSGEMESKAMRNTFGGDVSYDIYEKKPETPQASLGVYVKFNTYLINGDPGGTPITFWKKYPVLTSPFRYQNVTSYRDGQITAIAKQYNGTNHLQVTKETLSNSDGKVTETEYKYSFGLPGLPAAQLTKFIDLNLLVPLETAVKVGGTIVNGNKTEYGFFDNTSGNFLSTTASATTNFIRPYQFKSYEGAGWVQKGQIDSYHGTGTSTGRAGLPKQFTKTGWLAETYEWTSAGLIKQRKFKDFLWKYEYLTGTNMVSKVTNPDGQFTEYTYDKLLRLDEAKARASNVKTKYTYTFPVVNASGVITSFGNVKSTTTFTATAGSSLATQETFQYVDGLGRGIETVHKGKTPSDTDQVIATAYDNQGRVSKSFEAFAGTANTGAYQAPGTNAHTLTEYEPNPLNRIWKVTPPVWAATTNTYAANTSGDAVLNYNFATGASTTFGANLLTKTTTTDGNGNKSITFTDKKGRMLLSRKANGAESSKSDTYYVYDDKDRLVRVLPPGATWSDTELVFTYQYTNNDLISQKKVPGKAYEAFEYNSRDLPVRYQDPILRANSNRWMGSKYDDYGRLSQKGVYGSGTGDGIVLSNKIIENIYSTATTGIETDKLKTSKVQAFTVADPVVTPAAANAVLQTTFNYDTYGRVSSTTGNNHTNVASTSAESVTYGYDHGDNILSETRTSVHSGGTTSITNTRLFDAWGRLTQTSQSINGASATVISRLAYTAKDQLANKKLGPGTNGLQQVDYAYLTNGLLSSINGTAALSGSTFPVSNMLTNFSTPTFAATTDDLFRQTLEYNTLTTGLSGTAQNSGNIGQMIWQVKGRAAQAYGFTYDYLDRLTSAKYSSYTNTGTINTADYYGEAQTFDVRGNITSITRKGMVKGTANYTNATIDGQTLTIPAGGNLTSQSIGVNSIPPTRVNMDAPHNHLNLPSKFDFGTSNVIELLYDGLGNKLRKTVKTAGTTTLTQDYLDGIELKNNTVEAVYNEEGRAFNNGGTFRYEYVLRDHLGNTRVVFSDKNNSGSIDNTEILSETHYYPFGKSFDGAWYSDATAEKYRYLYNGKELSEEFSLNFYDYGARWLDPSMESWWEVDGLSEKYYSLSPYAYVANNVINAFDPDGKRIFWVGGAGNDQIGWNYTNSWKKAMTEGGINGFTRLNVSHDDPIALKNGGTPWGDIMFTALRRSQSYDLAATYNENDPLGSNRGIYTKQVPIEDSQVNNAYNGIIQNIQNSPLRVGEQLNLIGYSYGSVLQAHVALKLANSGHKIDNLVLVGSPISNDSELYKTLISQKNIGKVIRYDIPGDKLSNPKSLLDFIQGGRQNGDPNNIGAGSHFDLARPGISTYERVRNVVVEWLKQQGVK
ncbi:RHS repeat-associated protein [Dyadobacter jejuensis]|uniref:RHS repeat-associated protein n=1 Tax=Dyadobacter jejuensis TaxID=1082580 RepID=A0A316AH46_9BACT|nr:DUF6443 domain-containing protein [Dyadobacter jejuensis]PWJ57065.1 RHS repeat-associated protein [Dyadobacter jejuensis]